MYINFMQHYSFNVYLALLVYMFLHNLLNILVQIANKMGLQKKPGFTITFYTIELE
jgi:hypothetical protein